MSKQVMNIKVSDTMVETYMAKAKLVHEEYGTPETYGMDLDVLTKIRCVKDIDPEFGPSQKKGEDGKLVAADGRYTMEEWGQIVMVLKYGSNANAVNNRLHQVKKSKTASLTADYANIG